MAECLSGWKRRLVSRFIDRGGVIAYPTEGVYGLGCDPCNEEAVLRLLDYKQRPLSKGLILIGSNLAQLTPFIRFPDASIEHTVKASWPGPVTWVLPATDRAPSWVRGDHDTLAVRLTAHPLASELCRVAGTALVSTSANPAGRPPARNVGMVRKYFCSAPMMILSGALGGLKQATPIMDARQGRFLRGSM